jgi:hypothetical protein
VSCMHSLHDCGAIAVCMQILKHTLVHTLLSCQMLQVLGSLPSSAAHTAVCPHQAAQA